MKYVLEFGILGGHHCGEIVIPTKQLAMRLASGISHVFDGEHTRKDSVLIENPTAISASRAKFWDMASNCPRLSWSDSCHFVSLSRLDGVDRGPASANLWRKDK